MVRDAGEQPRLVRGDVVGDGDAALLVFMGQHKHCCQGAQMVQHHESCGG